ncbi:hypothetical protein [Xanthomonas sp. 3058]|uniref:hypothetical protein n=1 Tax=Xanthomonas sp. 3058 TaxID=3035314 RepID=UPI0016077A99|nr:hypothetical protein [Xanthomonas sp. 3058]MBB5863527.1 putative membrane channel-forming protein YqfA (hemolysin III family) [Xanthomonas sp. 3058]
MSDYGFGLSNPYLKIGRSLVMVALVAIAFTSFFLPDRDLQAIVRNIGGVVLLSGAVVYAIGRFVQAKHARVQA